MPAVPFTGMQGILARLIQRARRMRSHARAAAARGMRAIVSRASPMRARLNRASPRDSRHDPAAPLACGAVVPVSPAIPTERRYLVEMLARGMDETTEEPDRYRIAEALTTAIYPKYKFSEFGRLFLEDGAFIDYYRGVMDPGNWHSLDRKYTLDQLLKLTLDLEGDTAECGVYKGASSYLICRAIRPGSKRHHLFDSFQGLSAPTSVDGAYWTVGALQADEHDVLATLDGFDNFVVHAGWIPERFHEVADARFSFLHVDVDLYAPTRASIEFFYDRMNPGGVMLFDDYGFTTCPGAKLAVDEFFSTRPEPTVMLPTGQAFIVKQAR
jgi:hypothetical protein